MFRIYKILVLLLIISTSANSQISEADFDNVVNYCACKISFEYANRYIEKGNSSEKEKESFSKVIKPKIEDCNFGKSIQSQELINLLSEDNFKTFSTTFSKVLDSIKKSYTANTTVDSIIESFFDETNYPGYGKILKAYNIGSIKNELEDHLKKNVQHKNIQHKKPVGSRDPKQTNTSEQLMFPKWVWVIPLLTLLSLIVSVLALLLLNKKTKHLNESPKNANDNQLISLIEDVEDIKNIISELKEIKSELRSELNDKTSKMQLQINDLLASGNPNIAESKKNKDISHAPVKKQNVLYASAPKKDGSFRISAVEPYESQKSFYKFIFKEGENNNAKFYFIDNNRSVIDALNNPEMIIEPVCNERNALQRNAKSIKTKVPGIVKKQNDKWILETKAEVIYE